MQGGQGEHNKSEETAMSKHRRGTAYHEAGHAVILWAFGGGELDYIDMGRASDADAMAQVQAYVQSSVQRVDVMVKLSSDQSIRWRLVHEAKRRVMYTFAGWISEGIDSGQLVGLKGEYTREGWCYDWDKAIATGRAVYGCTQVNRFLHRMAAWTLDAVTHPRIWPVIAALAERLQSATSRMYRREAYEVMDAAWGEGRKTQSYYPWEREMSLPCLSMGPQWRRRFLRAARKISIISAD
jgi:hypothetical protein